MKKLVSIILLLISIQSNVTIVKAQSNSLSVQDSIEVFYDSLFYELEYHFLYRKEVDWKSIKSHTLVQAKQYSSFEKSLQVCTTLFDTIKGNHLHLFAGNHHYSSTLNPALKQDDFHLSFLKEFEKRPAFQVKVLDNQYGYILIPGIMLIQENQTVLDSTTQAIYDAVIATAQTHDIKGWIIDLRFNGGGNSYTMLAGLYHLVGNHTVYLSLDSEKNVKTLHALKDGLFYQNEEIITTAKTTIAPTPDIPVALISGKMTASSGEFVLLGFRGRENTMIIGEESYGLLTGNDAFKLPFNTTAAITLGYGTDRKAVYTPTIVPDVLVLKEANFTDLTQDKNIIEAMRFIDQKQ